ncbi:3-hydroxybutyrate dehydrogenase [Desulfuromonas versatilis]|uniref:3-hydroxybutyrate dehydrogenase n=1 Tax=Desulfuromonas versatilis TaxID=2802975 RepID=A0ABM8HSM8_9BACT|nr:3-hydroxybutyrate dehydrogenase [Desulfuromonas versatilis]BCR03983.1 3-hydroxybutyrate dehydrogenase [Desulfuromonas versatilis]
MSERIAIVTGASSGIGLAVSQALAAQGDKVVMADVNVEAGTREAEKLGGLFVQADLSKRADCKKLVDAAIAKYGRVDILVNNAGIQHVSPVEEFPEDKWDFMISLMLTAPFLLTRYAWPSMKERKWGRIIHINSVHGLIASPFKSAYISAKHGLSGLTKTTALEGGPHGITVNSICPAYVRTPLVDKQIADQAKVHKISEAEVVETIMLKNAAVKRLIEPSEIGELVVYLCSDKAACFTGSCMTMDCGWTAT